MDAQSRLQAGAPKEMPSHPWPSVAKKGFQRLGFGSESLWDAEAAFRLPNPDGNLCKSL